ncbi:flagellar biosynthetic protein FliR [Enterobacter cancerogenus]|jgi:flagellar biosynthesis protein FliR|uniref:Flagellar biosynthetic protein FliR n=1 Tax=Enterobacter cancerogenus TaxID=69218 RepID=A0AAP8TGP9_9ENTR|nr:flagellar biosynthetic protein FliR [Enterobacter cancerogenus]MDI9226447.1 flagellar biosynthetic protein FliR [Serratia bockelmannii]AUJ79810.1 flagellar biosynthetic protein FliR [Enterobacter cancerogenus]EFC55253.1 flagellar biosynthetic protein FliR [Enterobacter cancerogenus ATCC 35316]EKS7429186.1 flagellar biosynthetic protein FliR [Enterobacter cancerogenus]KTQ45282.1 flagellar biosynthesis protein FliR [Enterobacter cancerogenus]
MGIDISTLINPLLALVFPFFRILAFLHFCPVLDNRAFSRRIKTVLALALAAIITPMLPEKVLITELMSMRTVLLIGEQLLWGMLFGMAMQLVFVALQTAGHILSMNMGLGMAMMNDPVNGSSTTVISQMIYTFCGLLFFVMDGHLLVVTILYKGFVWWPIGQAINKPTLLLIVQSLGWIMSSATLIAIPTTFVMLIVQGGFGLLNRVSPTLNLFSLGFPISMLFGLLCISMMMTNIPDHYLNLTTEILARLEAVRTH